MRLRIETGRAILLTAVLMVMATPGSAAAETVVNGDFESGTLSGWSVYQANPFGDWFAYQGTETPIGADRKEQAQGRDVPVQRPPQGTYAAVTDEIEPDTLILYQDIALEPGHDYLLSLVAYYDSYEPIAIPTPDTLSVAEEALKLPNGRFQENQQFRIDLMKPDAPLESVDPSDILRTLFETSPGDPPTMAPRTLTADLSAFAGQTVRLRIANAVTEEVFNAGVDAVWISSAPPGTLSRSHRRAGLSFGRPRLNWRSGITTLRVTVGGPGLLRAAPAPPRSTRVESAPRPIEPVTVPVARAKTVTIHLRPTPSARRVLRRKHKLQARIALTYIPTDGIAESASAQVAFRLARRSG